MYAVFEKLLKERGLTPYKVSKELGIAQSTLSDWKRGKTTPKQDKLQKLASYFDVSIQYLISGEGPRSSTENGQVRLPVFPPTQTSPSPEEWTNAVAYEDIASSLTSAGELYALQIQDDSMAPRFQPGDTILFRKQPQVDSGDIAVLFVARDMKIRLIELHESGMALLSYNPSVDPTRFYTWEEANSLPVTVTGRVIELIAHL